MQAVPAARLANSTLPHMLAAREIAGPAGRLLMGVAVFAGVLGAVNGFFLMGGGALADLAGHGLLPGNAGRPAAMRRSAVIFAASVAILMISGLAGHQDLERYIQAALILWLAHVGVLCLAAGRTRSRRGRGSSLRDRLAFGPGLLLLRRN